MKTLLPSDIIKLIRISFNHNEFSSILFNRYRGGSSMFRRICQPRRYYFPSWVSTKAKLGNAGPTRRSKKRSPPAGMYDAVTNSQETEIYIQLTEFSERRTPVLEPQLLFSVLILFYGGRDNATSILVSGEPHTSMI